MKKNRVIIPFLLLTVPFTIYGQELYFGDLPAKGALRRLAPGDSNMVLVCFRQDVEYLVTGSNILFFNWQPGDNASNITVAQKLVYRSQISNGRNFRVSGTLLHDLGVQYFFDSIIRFFPDNDLLDTRFEIRLWQRWSASAGFRAVTRIFSGYSHYRAQDGRLIRILNGTFLTPLVINFSAGISWTEPAWATITLGLTGCKLTYVHNRSVYDLPGRNIFSGVPREKPLVFEYGISLQFQVDRKILKNGRWNCDLLLFSGIGKTPEMSLRNQFMIPFNRWLKGTIQTRMLYEKAVSPRLRVENQVSIGIGFQL